MSDPSLTARYNNPKKIRLAPRTRNWLIAAGLVVAVAIAGWFALHKYEAISAQDLHFDVNSATSATALIEVQYNAKDRVQCDIRAMNDSKAVVGYKTVLMDPGEQTGTVTQRLNVDLHTDSLAVTAGVEGCYAVPHDFKG